MQVGVSRVPARVPYGLFSPPMWPPEFRRQIVEGEKKFEEIAKTESDCSSARNGGDLGPFTRGMMQKPFEDATWVLGGIRFAGWPHLFVVLPGLG